MVQSTSESTVANTSKRSHDDDEDSGGDCDDVPDAKKDRTV